MRITLTLDDDVASGLMVEVRRTGRPFDEVLNELLRHGLATCGLVHARQTLFTIQARELGALHAGLSLDNIGALLDSVEGPTHR